MALSLVGSREELAHRCALAAAAGQIVVVAGASGAGRTEVLRRVQQLHSGPVLSGGGLAGLRSVPNLALSRALRLPVPAGDPARAADFVIAAAGRSTLLVLDDLHLADPSTLQVVALLAGQLPVVLAVADDTSSGVGIRAALARLPVTIIEGLPPLDDDEASEIARTVYLGNDPTALRSILRAAGGNPAALLAVARDPQAPDLRSAVATRLARLEPPARTVLCLLGLLGRPIRPALIGDRLAQAAADAGVVVEQDGWLSARSNLDVEVALAVLPLAQRRSLHAELARRVPDPGEQARHYEAAGDSAAAIRTAGLAAAASTSAVERLRYEAIAARVATGPEHAEACLTIAVAASDAADHQLALALLAAAGEGSDPRIELIRARVALAAGDPAGALAHIDRIADPGSDELALLVALERARAWCLADPISAMDLASEAFGVAISDQHRCRAGGVLGSAQLAAGADGWDETLEAAGVLAQACGLRDVALAAAANRCAGLLRAGRPEEAAAVAGAAAAQASATGLSSWASRFTSVILWIEVQVRAELTDGLRTGQSLLDAALAPTVRREVTAQVVLAYADGGQLAEALAILDGAEAGGPDLLGWCEAEVDALGGDRRRAGAKAAAVLSQAQGWPVLDLAAVTAAWSGSGPRSGSGPGSYGPGSGPASDGTRSYEPRSDGTRSYEPRSDGTRSYEPRSYEQSPVSAAALELDALACVEGDPSRAAELFGAAAQRWAGVSRRSVVRCRLAAAVASAEADPEAAVLELRSLAQDLEGAELVMLARQVTRARRQFGDPDVPIGTTGPRGARLSRRESEVMAGVAEGLTTVVIAGRLGVAPSTVESQVKSAMRKLGAATRTEAAVLAIQ